MNMNAWSKSVFWPKTNRVELLNGEIIEKMSPIGSWHSFVVNELHYQLLQVLDRSNSIRNQSSIKLTKSSMPEPDLIVLKYQADRYRHQLLAQVIFC